MHGEHEVAEGPEKEPAVQFWQVEAEAAKVPPTHTVQVLELTLLTEPMGQA